mmetsp:Transcript_12119/g.17473  ORF Transcript_12119/g.17473 Transcript_12119/m.17473 type:complete len:329 (+) Transcript_12119:2922-3908(+)
MFLVHDSFEERGNRGSNELAESAFKLSVLILRRPNLAVSIKVPVSPEFFNHLLLWHTELGTIGFSELLKGECPLMKTTAKRNSPLAGVYLHISKLLVVVGSADDVHTFNRTAKCLVKLLRRKLKFQECTVHLVDHEHRTYTFRNRLTQHSFGLNAHSVNGVHDNQRSVSDTKSCCDLRGEVDVTWRINQVDQIRVFCDPHVGVGGNGYVHCIARLLLFLRRHAGGFASLPIILEVHGNSGRLDSDTTFRLVGSGICVACTTCSLGRDDSSLLNERVRQSCLSMIYVGNHRHGPDIVLQVHNGPHLVNRKVHHGRNKFPFRRLMMLLLF